MLLAKLAQGRGYGATVEAVLNPLISFRLERLFDVADCTARTVLGQLIGAFECSGAKSHADDLSMEITFRHH